MVANSNDDTFSLDRHRAPATVVQTVNVNPLPGSTVGSYPNAITMPDAHHILVSIGRDNALAVYSYNGAQQPVQYEGLLPTDFYPVNVGLRPGDRQDRRHQRQGHRRPRPGTSTINKGPGTSRPRAVTGHNTYDDTGSLTEFAMPSQAALGAYTHQVFVDNDWDHLLASHAAVELHRRAGGRPGPARLPVDDQARVPDHPGEPHLRPGARRRSARATATRPDAQFGATVTPNAHALANDFGLFDNFYDEGTLSADGHNWLVQADANDYIEKEFGAFYRSYPAQGGDALAYQRDGFLWNAARGRRPDGAGLRRVQQLHDRDRSAADLVGVLPGLADHARARRRPAAGARRRRSTPTPTSRR